MKYVDTQVDYITLDVIPNDDGDVDFKADCDDGAPMVTVTLSAEEARDLARRILDGAL